MSKVKMHVLVLLFVVVTSCTTMKLSIPEQFSTQATQMQVKGLKKLNARKPISFGNYHTSKIKRGWHTTTSYPQYKFGITKEQLILSALNIKNDLVSSNEKAKYQYTIQDGNLAAEVYCHERMQKEVFEVKTGVGWLGDFSRTDNYQYTFSAVIVPLNNDENPWKLEFYNLYDRHKDTAKRLLDLPYVEEDGLVSNGKDTIKIKPIRVSNVTTNKGRDAKLPVKIISGYELRIDDGVIAIVDTQGHHVWIYNELDPSTKLIVASISSALLLRKVQDVTG